MRRDAIDSLGSHARVVWLWEMELLLLDMVGNRAHILKDSSRQTFPTVCASRLIGGRQDALSVHVGMVPTYQVFACQGQMFPSSTNW